MIGLSLWSHPRTNPKSEVTHCLNDFTWYGPGMLICTSRLLVENVETTWCTHVLSVSMVWDGIMVVARQVRW